MIRFNWSSFLWFAAPIVLILFFWDNPYFPEMVTVGLCAMLMVGVVSRIRAKGMEHKNALRTRNYE
jgi:hypothetical protein